MPAPFDTEYGIDRFWGLDVEDRDSEVVVRAEVPGFEPDELDVQVRGRLLTIKAEKKPERQYVVYTLALYLFLHLLEGYVLLPLIQSRAVHLPPALTLVAQALMGEMFGILGLFVAAPLTVAVMVLLKMLYVEDTLGDKAVNLPGEPGNDVKKATQKADAGLTAPTR